MAAQDITQERLILSNLVQLFLFRAPQFALFPLPSHATSLLSVLSCCLPIALLVLFFLRLKIFFCKGLSLVCESLSPARSLHLAGTTLAATRHLLRTEHPPGAPSPTEQLPGPFPLRRGTVSPCESCITQSSSPFFSPPQAYSIRFTEKPDLPCI